jgi:alpha-ketoglutaric semialdehyde dehydrogenase
MEEITMTTDAEHRCSYIDGSWRSPHDGETYEIFDPGQPGRAVARYVLATEKLVDQAVTAALTAAPGWADTPIPSRGDLVFELIDAWAERVEELGEVVTSEMGKPLHESRSEATRAISEMRFWASEAWRLGERTFPSAREGMNAYVVRQPIGVVAGITPWNFPILSPIRKVIPALVCGCPIVLKPALEAPGASVILAELLDQVGVPSGVFNLLLGRGRDAGARLVAHPDVAGITFTGSTQVGVGIGEQAAQRNAKVQLEMGGKNAAVVVGASDHDAVAKEIVKAAFAASGQRCTSISRVIVTREEQASLEEALARETRELRVGHGLEPETDMGPLASQAQFDKVTGYLELARKEGHRVVVGGGQVEDLKGFYIEPTIVSDVPRGSALASEEIFGPLLVVVPVDSFEEAVEANNETPYGLTASIFSDDPELAQQFIRRSQTGMVHVNHGTNSEGHLPFGGVKDSGRGAYGIGDTSKEFFTELKAVYHKPRT